MILGNRPLTAAAMIAADLAVVVLAWFLTSSNLVTVIIAIALVFLFLRWWQGSMG